MTKKGWWIVTWLSVPALCVSGAIFGWIQLMVNIKNSGGSAMLFVVMYYASLPVGLSAVWIGLLASEYMTSRFTSVS